MSNESSGISGTVTWELRGPDGELKRSGVSHNLITDVGDQMYAARGSGITSPPAAPTGMQIGTGSTAVAKSGAGSHIVTYLIGQAFDGSFPTAVDGAGTGSVATYKTTYAAGTGTTASAVTEAVIVNNGVTLTDATGANTIARVLLTGIGSKGASDTLAVTWTHTLLGQ